MSDRGLQMVMSHLAAARWLTRSKGSRNLLSSSTSVSSVVRLPSLASKGTGRLLQDCRIEAAAAAGSSDSGNSFRIDSPCSRGDLWLEFGPVCSGCSRWPLWPSLVDLDRGRRRGFDEADKNTDDKRDAAAWETSLGYGALLAVAYNLVLGHLRIRWERGERPLFAGPDDLRRNSRGSPVACRLALTAYLALCPPSFVLPRISTVGIGDRWIEDSNPEDLRPVASHHSAVSGSAAADDRIDCPSKADEFFSNVEEWSHPPEGVKPADGAAALEEPHLGVDDDGRHMPDALEEVAVTYQNLTATVEGLRGLDLLLTRGRTREGLRLLRRASRRGDPEATFNLGVVHERGLFGVEQSHRRALGYYLEASKAGYPPAFNNLAVFYELGLGGLEKDAQKAAELFRTAEDLLKSGSVWNERVRKTGQPHRRQEPLPPPLPAVSSGASLQFLSPDDLVRLGRAYKYGLYGTPKDPNYAAEFFKVALLGDQPGVNDARVRTRGAFAAN